VSYADTKESLNLQTQPAIMGMKSRLAIGFGLILILLTINAAVSYNHTSRLIANDRRVTHTYQVLNELDDRVSLTKAAETGTRDYIITGRREYLDAYRVAIRRMQSSNVDPLDEQVWDDPTVRQRVLQLDEQITRRLEFCRKAIALRRTKGTAEAQQYMLENADKLREDMTERVQQMQDEQRSLLERRLRESEASAGAASLTIGVAALANLVLLAFVWSLLVRADVQRARLEQAYRDLQRANDMRDSLTAMLVHDLRTPLTTMIGSLEMLKGDQGDALDAELRHEMIGMSTQGGYRLLGLVNQLLDISKMEAGQMNVRRETLSIPDVVGEALNQVMRLDLGEAHRITRVLPPDLPPLQADRDLLVRVLVNLLGNALKFTPADGTITVGARTVGTREDGKREPQSDVDPLERGLREEEPIQNPKSKIQNQEAIVFFVRDTGEGIPRDEIDRIFDKFAQAESRKAGHKMSTGLGLTFCKLAVEAHGGRIWVESEPGRGSTFSFSIPVTGPAAQTWSIATDSTVAAKH
jgi:signal transduction histidine kinase